MASRFVSLWFRQLTTDYFSLRRPALRPIPFVLAAPDHGRMIISAANLLAQDQGVTKGMAVADARALIPSLEVLDDPPGLAGKLLHSLALWCIRYTPVCGIDAPSGIDASSGIDAPSGLVLDVSGCSHLWGGEPEYLEGILTRLGLNGYAVRAAMADTIGAAWGIARYGGVACYGGVARFGDMDRSGGMDRSGRPVAPIIESGAQTTALLPHPPTALRLDAAILDRLQRLGLYRIGDIAGMPRSALRRRFGPALLLRLDQAFGREPEVIEPVQPVAAYQERLPCLEPIQTAGGIEIALTRLLEMLCGRLQREGKGLRTAIFTGYRVDGKLVQIDIGTNRATHHIQHLFKLFEQKIPTIEPDPGIELFVLEARIVEDVTPKQELLWHGACGLEDTRLSELLDRVANKVGAQAIHRYIPSEHHWPERSLEPVASLDQKPASGWPVNRPRPIHLLPSPHPIEVAAPIPDYPPMHFRYKGKLHTVIKSDGPERIEQEWWIENARHRDYYAVEDEEGARYWLFRSGHYGEENQPARWFLHGFFA